MLRTWSRQFSILGSRAVLGRRKRAKADRGAARLTRRDNPSSCTLGLESLEQRITPVVGALAALPPVAPGAGFDGVVQLTFNGGGSCSGSLLYTGRHILTAAHCLDGDRDTRVDPGITGVNVTFDMPGAVAGTTQPITIDNIPASNITVHPGWNGDNRDFAIIELPEIAPAGAERYQLYRSSDEVGRVFTVVGYGATGTGTTGPTTPFGTKHLGQNRFDETSSDGTRLHMDFDDGTAANNSFGDRGIPGEASVVPGDSGGPCFLDGQIAGVNHWLTSPSGVFGTFGDTVALARVSLVTGWIDATIGGRHELVLDMNDQPAGNNGVADEIRVVHTREGLLQLILNGHTLHEEAAANVTAISILGSADRDNVIILSSGSVPVTIDGRGGTNQTTLGDLLGGLTSVGDVTIVGTDGTDTLEVNGAGLGTTAATYTLTEATLTRAGDPGVVRFYSMENVGLSAGRGNDTVYLLGTHPATRLTTIRGFDGIDTFYIRANSSQLLVEGGPQDDRFILGSLDSRLQFITSRLTINGQDGSDTVTLNDQGRPTGQNYTCYPGGPWVPGSVVWTAVSLLSYGTVENVALNAGTGADRFNVVGVEAGVQLTIDGGGAVDELVGPNVATVWTINGANAGSFPGAAFRNTETLIGGNNRDEFGFVGAGRVDQRLDGGEGINSLNYTGYASAVHVNLTTGAATGVAGRTPARVANIVNVIGGSYNDILVGNANANLLVGRDGRDLLIGRLGADTLDGGAGEDLLIGGVTDFDANDAALIAIMREWGRVDLSHRARIANLRSGGGLAAGVKLTGGTVHDDGAADRLTGSTDLDWFWAFGFDSTDRTIDKDPLTAEMLDELVN